MNAYRTCCICILYILRAHRKENSISFSIDRENLHDAQDDFIPQSGCNLLKIASGNILSTEAKVWSVGNDVNLTKQGENIRSRTLSHRTLSLSPKVSTTL